MTMSTIPVSDHPAGVNSMWRLRGYLRPHALSLTVMAVASIAAVGLTIAIPLVTKALIDGPITDRELGPVLPLGLLALGLGVLEAVLIWIRRWVQSNAVLGLETAMRHDLYERLQQLPMSFHTKWQSGQLLSRATTDLSAIRRFSGFGLLFLVINVLQVTVVTGVLLHMYWPLGLVVAAAAAPIVWLSMRFEKAYVVVPRRGPVRRRGPHPARDEHGQGPAVGEVLDLPRGHPQPRRRGGPAARRHRRGPRGAHPRGAGRVHHADALAGLAGVLAGRDPGDGPGGHDGGRAHPRDLRHRARHRLGHDRRRAAPGPPAPRARRLRVPRR